MSFSLIDILNGWKNYIIEDEVAETKAIARASICAECPSAQEGTIKFWGEDSIEEITGLVCGECGCPLSAKVRAKDTNCDLNKWD